MAYKVGDKVKVSPNCDYSGQSLVGKEYTIRKVNSDGTYELSPNTDLTRWREDELTLVKDKRMATKYYRVKQDTFMWDAGAIISDEKGDGYRSINDLFNRVELDGEYITRKIIEDEDNADFFERVYPIGKLEKMVFGDRAAAKAAMSAGAFKATPKKK